jgi:single-stranded-DNA-specific exonuclease
MTEAAALLRPTTAADPDPGPPAARDPAPPAAVAPRLQLAGYDLGAALRLQRELGIGHVLAQVLVRRGLPDPKAATAFLEARERHDAAKFDGIDRAIAVIERHLGAGSRITVHGDYDVDGVCATATLVRALKSRGGAVDWFLPGRIDDGYGLSSATVSRLARRGTELLITVDCAITAVDEIAAAQAAGLDVVVTDHHAPRADGRLPNCPVVHPAVSGYPCPELCGTGVAYKLAHCLDAPTAAEDVELVALATVADLMPLHGENRRLVREGMAALANTAKPGLQALMEVSRVDPSGLDTHALGFRLAPRINAAGRLRRADAGLELLLTDDHRRARQIAAELDAVNVERRAVEQRILWEAEAQVAELGSRFAYVLAGANWHPGVIGIVASRIVERHHRPAILISVDAGAVAGCGEAALSGAPAADPEDSAQGSGRSIPGFDLLNALHACAAHLDRYGGHRAAAGLTIARSAIDSFRAAFERHAEAVLTPELLEPADRIDAVASGSQLGLALAEELARLEPCGIGNPRARLLVPGARFDDVRSIGEGRHARFSVSSGGARARAVAFGCDGRPGPAATTGEPVDASFCLERNVWNGAVEPRLVLRHARPCTPAPIEVIGEPADFVRSALDELDTPLVTDEQPVAAGTCGGPGPRPVIEPRRTRLDRRGESPLAVLADALAADGPVLAVCADVPRRLPGIRSRTGGFTLASYHALEREPAWLRQFTHIVALDPPARPATARLLDLGCGFSHQAWGEAELRFAWQMHELEYGLRASLAALYRGLKTRWRVTGEELEHLLRGDRERWPARLAGRLLRVLAELELVSLDRDLPALAIAGTAPTALERSAAYRVYSQRLEDGRRFLRSANPRSSS